MKLSREQVINCVDSSMPVETKPWKFGRREKYVLELDGKFYRFSVEFHHSEGLQLFGDVEAEEVRPFNKIVTEYLPVIKTETKD